MIRWGQEKHQEFLKNNFQKDWTNLFPGCWGPGSKDFSAVGGWADCWLSGGGYVEVGKDGMDHNGNHPRFGFSLRLLKD